MARSKQYWLDVILAEKAVIPELAVYSSTSKVGRWRLTAQCMAACYAALDVVFDLVILAMEALATKSRYGTLPWYVAIAKEFQYGDALTQVNLEWVYSPVVEANRIVAFSAAAETDGVVNLKVARVVTTDPEPLSAPQQAAFEGY